MKKASSTLLQQGIGIILFIICVLIVYNAASKLITPSNQQFLEQYHDALIKAAKLQPGEVENILLQLPPNTALISMNIGSDFSLELPDRNYRLTTRNIIRGTQFRRPSLCSNLNTCTCLCQGFNPLNAISSDGIGQITCDNLICLASNEFQWESETTLTNVFDFPTPNPNYNFLQLDQHIWKNSSIIIRSSRISTDETNSPRRSFGDSTLDSSSIRMVPIISGWQGFGDQQLLDVNIIKVEQPNIIRLCFKESCQLKNG